MTGDYRLVFDIAAHPTGLGGFILVPLVFTGIGALLVFKPALMQRLLPRGPQGRARTAFAWVYFLFSVTVTLAFLASHLSAQRRLQSALTNGTASVVEGCLDAFHPMPAHGHETERLWLKGRCLAYSDFIATPGFNHTEVRGGPVHADSGVRITHADGVILRLEVRDHACPPAPDIEPGPAC